MPTTGDRYTVLQFFRSKLQEGQLAYLRTGNAKVGHATAVVKLGGTLYSINNQNWYTRLRVPRDQLQPLERYLQDWESWTRNPRAFGDPATYQSSTQSVEYDGFTTSYWVQADQTPRHHVRDEEYVR